MGRVIQTTFQGLGPTLEAEMFVTAVVTVLLCTASVAFYVRFLVALCKECNPRPSGYWVRLRLRSGENTISELQERKKQVARAA
jgi:hypothetical protein